MKKIYILICFFAISVITIAQVKSTINQIDYTKSFNQSEATNIQDIIPLNNMNTNSTANIIWESDFSDPSDWILDNSGQNPPVYGWSIDANSDGWWSQNGITSTSGGNFAAYNASDLI